MAALDGFNPQAVRHVDLWEPIAAALRRAIILGELPPGTHLQEPALAAKFAVSRVPVREALGRLEYEGLVRTEARRGAFVVGLSEEDLHDAYEVRLFTECRAVRRLAGRLTTESSAALRALADEMVAAARRGQTDLIAAPDVAFHRTLLVLAGSRRLLAAWETVGGLMSAILSITNVAYHDIDAAATSHYHILAALEQGDAARAEHLLEAHLRNGEQILRQAVRSAAIATLAARPPPSAPHHPPSRAGPEG